MNISSIINTIQKYLKDAILMGGELAVIILLIINLFVLNDECRGEGELYSDPSTSVQKNTIISAIALGAIGLLGKTAMALLQNATDLVNFNFITHTTSLVCSIAANLLTAVSLGHALTIRDEARCPGLKDDNVLFQSLAAVITIGVVQALESGTHVANIGKVADAARKFVKDTTGFEGELREVVAHHEDRSIRF